MPLTSKRRDELEEPRFDDLSDVSYVDDAMFPLFCDTAEQLSNLPVRSSWGSCSSRAPRRGSSWTSCGKTKVIFLTRGPGKPHAMGTYIDLRDRRFPGTRLQRANGTCASLGTPIAPRATTAKVKMGVTQRILGAMVCWDAASWDPPSQVSLQQSSPFQAKVARRAIDAQRQAGGIREMLGLPRDPRRAPHAPPPKVGCSGCELPTAAQTPYACG